jgi:glycerol uptake facilitator-like aquaporin
MKEQTLSRTAVAEFLGTALLVCAVVGSGIMAERLSSGNVAIALLANTIATGAALFVLIMTFASTSGAHFNPVVSHSAAMTSDMPWRDLGLYIPAQIVGGVIGVAIANLMFDLPPIVASTKVRDGGGIWLGEFVATFGLVGTVIAVSRRHKTRDVAMAVAGFITAAYWFTSSTSFANPAVTIARALTESFTGIRPIDAPMFIFCQIVGAIAATYLFNWLVPKRDD